MKTRAKLWLFSLALGVILPCAAVRAQTVVSFTFDDGLVSHKTAQQLLDSRGMKRTLRVRMVMDEASHKVRATDYAASYDWSAGRGGANLEWKAGMGLGLFQR